MMALPGVFAPVACSACLSFKNPDEQITRPVICLWEAFLLTDKASGATRQHDQQVFFWWLSPPGPEWVPSLSRSSKVPASWGPVAALGPPALLSTPPVESIPRLFPDDSWRHQFEFHIRSLGGEKRKKKIPPSHRNHQLFQQHKRLHCVELRLSQQGGSQRSLPPACSRPTAQRWPGAAAKPAATWGDQPCSHLLWDTRISCGIKTVASQAAAAWDAGVSVDGS